MNGFRQVLALLAALLLGWGWIAPTAWAGPVAWQEVPATAEGRQWWDSGSLRLSRQGNLTVLSRFQPAPPNTGEEEGSERPPASTLYVMELDCGQELYRDISVNGLPRFRAEWQAVSGDSLTTEILRASCRAGADLLPSPALDEVVHG
ncbi:MAG: hypothetical protein ACK587_10270 [Cyanobacteriota bacterium]